MKVSDIREEDDRKYRRHTEAVKQSLTSVLGKKIEFFEDDDDRPRGRGGEQSEEMGGQCCRRIILLFHQCQYLLYKESSV